VTDKAFTIHFRNDFAPNSTSRLYNYQKLGAANDEKISPCDAECDCFRFSDNRLPNLTTEASDVPVLAWRLDFTTSNCSLDGGEMGQLRPSANGSVRIRVWNQPALSRDKL
jgi:hypothetical protein